jgi:starvation-inducible outer membrane lipoprotein
LKYINNYIIILKSEILAMGKEFVNANTFGGKITQTGTQKKRSNLEAASKAIVKKAQP